MCMLFHATPTECILSREAIVSVPSKARKGKAEPGKNVPLSKNESGWKCYFRKLLDGFPTSLPHTYTHARTHTCTHTNRHAHVQYTCFCSVKLSFL